VRTRRYDDAFWRDLLGTEHDLTDKSDSEIIANLGF